MKTKEFKKKIQENNVQELEAMHRNSVQELFNLKFQLKTGHLEDPTKVRQLKKNIARVNTMLSERKRGEA